MLAHRFQLLTQLLDLTVQFVHGAFEMRCSRGGVVRAIRPPSTFRWQRSFAARESLGIPRQGLRLGV